MTDKKEILWHVINSFLAGALVFAGAFIDGNITQTGIIAAGSAALIVLITKFREFWLTTGKSTKAFNFIN